MQKLNIAVVLAAVGMMASTPVLADDHAHHMASHEAMSSTSGDEAPSTQAFKRANMTMHEKMAIDFTGNADVDFVRGMIAHHQGAVDMAKVELQYGQSPEMKSLAQQIVSSQEHEIQQMQQWLKNHAPG